MGVPAARGHGGDGGAETRGAFKLPESNVIMPPACVRGYSPPGSISPGTSVPSFDFGPISLYQPGLAGYSTAMARLHSDVPILKPPPRGDTLALVSETFAFNPSIVEGLRLCSH